jgi:hypothetical protein
MIERIEVGALRSAVALSGLLAVAIAIGLAARF